MDIPKIIYFLLFKGKFVWKSGAPFTYTSWRAHEPNSGSLSGCYAVHTFVGDFSWNDAKCSYTTWPRNWAGKKWRPLCKKEKPGSTGTVGFSYSHLIIG